MSKPYFESFDIDNYTMVLLSLFTRASARQQKERASTKDSDMSENLHL